MSDRNLRLQVILNAVDKITRPFKSAQASNKRLAETLRQSSQQLRELNQQAGRIDGFRKVKHQLLETRQVYRSATERVAALNREINASQNPTQAQINQLQRAKNAARQFEEKNQSLSQSLQRQRDALRASGISTNQLGQAQRRINADINHTTNMLQQQEQQLGRLRQQEQRLANARSRYQKMKDVHNQMTVTGAAATAAGVGALYGAKRVMMPGYDFDVGMSKVQALTRLDKHSPELKKLQEQARHLGATTAFTANQVAQGQSFYAMAGFTPDQIRSAMPGTLAMSLAGDTDLAATADIGSNILTGFKLKSEEMGRVSDVLVGAFTRSNTNLMMLGDTMKYVAPVAAGLGVDIETAAAATGKLGDAGIQGSMAGTSLRSILGRLAEPPATAAKALAKLNIQTKDAKGNLRVLPDILTELDKKTTKMGNAQRAGIFKAIAGEEAFSALSVLAERAGTGELQKLIKELKNAQGEARKVADTMTNNLDGDLKSLSSAWEDIGIQIFGGVNSPLRGITQRITKIISKTGEWMKANPELTKTLTMVSIGLGIILTVFGAITLALVALLGPLAIVKFGLSVLGIKGAGSMLRLGNVFSYIGKMAMWLGHVMWTNPILAVIGLIAVGAYLIWQYWDKLGPWFQNLWNNISNYVSTTWENIKQRALAKWNELVADTKKIPSEFKKIGGEFVENLKAGIEEKWESLKKKFSELGKMVKDALTPDFMQEENQDPRQKAALNAYKEATGPIGGILAGGFDKGGYIPTGKIGIVGEYGPEIINGPARVTSRRQTAALATIAALSVGAVSPVSAQNAPLHPYSLPASQYQTSVVSVANQIQDNRRSIYEIHIHAVPAQSAQDIAQAVARELDRREQQQRARARSSFSDREDFYS
ncbi:phage tail tape measure protein [Photorhabdus hainanensis]|uniref:phage tail tape measure protein n=1 Tax=Photorhabdus hainanensis TaxID=1004166 RepID=UPI001BD24BAB|nr:phage tail tape measure protein [Photorhabdus hainanensis]MBS9432196.1 phage tail tape measure protein [Photorhabdus hainanensis]